MADELENPSKGPRAELPPAPSDELVERVARALGAPIPAKSDERSPAEVE